ncbi:MAG TPA: hypothetical protein VF483_11260, partial [Gemmatimonadaceae bacterium]
ARGLVAGASRILMSLDDVPAVAPNRAPAAAPQRPQRFWQASPWVTGIAAALLLAVGVKEWRDRPSAQSAVASAQRTPLDSALNVAPAAAVPVDSGLRDRPVSPPSVKPLNAPPVPDASRRVADARSAAGAGVGSAVRADEARPPERFEKRRESAVATEAAPPAAAVASVAQAEPKTGIAEGLKPSSALMPPAPSPLRSVAVRDRSDERPLAGCYRLGGSASQRLSLESAGKAIAAAREPSGPARKLAQPSAAPAPALEAPSIVRLDTTMTSQGRVITSPSTGEAIGTWRAADGDSVRLMIVVTGAKTISIDNRVACPSREGRP